MTAAGVARLHRTVRIAAIAAAIAAPCLLVLRPSPPDRSPPPPLVIDRGVRTPDVAADTNATLFLATDPEHATAPPPSIAGAPPEPVGIVGRLPGDGRALVRLGDGTVKALAVGDIAQGWTLAAIAPDRLRFRRGGEERMLVLPMAIPADAPGGGVAQ